MKLTLSFLDRFELRELLPQHGGKIEMLLVSGIAKKIEFSEAEISEFGMRDTDRGVAWASSRDAEFEFTDDQIGVLKSASKRADENKQVTRQNLPLIEKIDGLKND